MVASFAAKCQGVEFYLCTDANGCPSRRGSSITFRCDQACLVEVEEEIAAALTASLAGAHHRFIFERPLLRPVAVSRARRKSARSGHPAMPTTCNRPSIPAISAVSNPPGGPGANRCRQLGKQHSFPIGELGRARVQGAVPEHTAAAHRVPYVLHRLGAVLVPAISTWPYIRGDSSMACIVRFAMTLGFSEKPVVVGIFLSSFPISLPPNRDLLMVAVVPLGHPCNQVVELQIHR